MKIKLGGSLMAGSFLLEVVLAIAVFAFGMLALIQLQGSLARSSADANTRTVAASIAEEFIERARGFTSVDADAATAAWEYKEMTEDLLTTTVNRGGVIYTVTASVDDYWYDPEVANFIATPNDTPPEKLSHLVYSDFKLLNLNVSWNDDPKFVVDDDPNHNVGLGSGSINIIEIVPGTPPILGAKVVAEDDGKPKGPPVPYIPGLAPDIVKLTLGNEKFKESTAPMPEVIRRDESVETWFDVVTFNQATDSELATFHRREEFVAISCECILRTPDTGEGGLIPTVFNGYSYTEGKMVSKNYGEESGSAQQSPFCDICCRDHHDGGTTEIGTGLEINTSDLESILYGPSGGAAQSDHAHYGYGKNGKGAFAEVTRDGEYYVEACRLIRKDGFMRVAKDFNQEGFYTFPQGYLKSPDGVADYGSFVIASATEYFESNPAATSMTQPVELNPPYTIPASSEWMPSPNSGVSNRTHLPTVPSAEFPVSTDDQQLRARGVYLDYLTAEAEQNIDDCFAGNGCINPFFDPAKSTRVEMYPFFDVQLTWLARWNPEDADGRPVDVTNEPLATDNAHDRGLAFLVGTDEGGAAQVIATTAEGNLGFTSTNPINEDYLEIDSQVFMTARGDNTPNPSVGFAISGTIGSDVNKIQPADFVLTGSDGVHCAQTNTEYSCFVPVDATAPSLTITGYLANFALWACSDSSALHVQTKTYNTTETTFFLAAANVTDGNIWVQKTNCPAPPAPPAVSAP